MYYNQQQSNLTIYIKVQIPRMQITTASALDSQLTTFLQKIQNHPYLLLQSSKHLQIRINSWITRLQTITSNNIWRKNRNNYIKLLYIMLQFRQIIQPFTSLPQANIPTLQKHQISCILLKLSTIVKQKQRQKADKQNRHNLQQKKPKTTPIKMWTHLQNKTSRSLSNNFNTTLIFQNDQLISTKNIDQTLQQQPGGNISILSPISMGDKHGRDNCNFSVCTYRTIEKFKDFRGNNQIVIENCEEAEELKQSDVNIQRSPAQHKKQSQIKYFKKNRQNSFFSNFSQINEEYIQLHKKQSQKQLYNKILTFLNKYHQQFYHNQQYSKIIQQLQSKQSTHQLQPPQHTNLYNLKKNNSRNSYDYTSDQYSQYSQIEVNQGLSPERIKHTDNSPIKNEEGLKKKSLLDNIFPSASSLMSIKSKIYVQNYGKPGNGVNYKIQK